MLKNTFCHLTGIGLKKESFLWRNGITTWEELQDNNLCCNNTVLRISSYLQNEINLSIEKYADKDLLYFAERLQDNQTWRIFSDFRDSVAYIDIETTGLYNPDITTIALYDGNKINYYVNGRNLDVFIDDIFRYKILVTYNGKCFDAPIIESFFNIRLNHVHIDLRYVLKSLGYSGGLKSCEKQLGISRGYLEGIDGYFAVLLWNEYCSNNNQKALETLLAYNIEDVINLEKLMVIAFNKKTQDIENLTVNKIPEPDNVEIPFKPHLDVITSLFNTHYHREFRL
ncbi:MAG: ribonuclease H-like domain-containing protein [Spirochaetes bacterium]|nr:ribonuclease H-like domain-containing protein [Spirochaetota bacterium]